MAVVMLGCEESPVEPEFFIELDAENGMGW
jgi:hypothetical protein